MRAVPRLQTARPRLLRNVVMRVPWRPIVHKLNQIIVATLVVRALVKPSHPGSASIGERQNNEDPYSVQSLTVWTVAHCNGFFLTIVVSPSGNVVQYWKGAYSASSLH